MATPKYTFPSEFTAFFSSYYSPVFWAYDSVIGVT